MSQLDLTKTKRRRKAAVQGSYCRTDGRHTDLGPDLQNILRQSYDYLTIMPTLRSTCDGRLVYKTSYEGRTDFS